MKILVLILSSVLVISVFGKKYFVKEKSEPNLTAKLIRNQSSIGDNVWPKPVLMVTSPTFFTVHPMLDVIYDIEEDCPQEAQKLLNDTIERYWNLMFVEDCSLVDDVNGYHTLFDSPLDLQMDPYYRGDLNNLTLKINRCDTESLGPDMNEKYSLNVSYSRAEISADSIWGAIRGLETFSQLLENVGLNQIICNSTWIEDYPRFKFRGLLLDSARHFLPLNRLKETLDAMSYNKMNVFHWHIVDDQSIPYVSQVFPDFSLKGAYNPKTHVYTPNDIEELIEYARVRGIRVLVEFDTPGHTLAWGKGLPHLLTPCYSGSTPNGHYGPIDPTKESTYDTIRKLFAEVAARFSDAYLHLGGDEVDFQCWRSNPNVVAFMKSHNLTAILNISSNKAFAKLEEFYILKVIAIAKSLNKKAVVWQEVFDNGASLDLNTLVHVWKLHNWQNELANVTKKKHQAILSSPWYLNKISYGTDWPKYYKSDPHSFNGTKHQYDLVIGGEAAVWGEWVDASNVIGRTWPRTCAVAERLWSPKEVNDPIAASGRFNRQHCLMQKRGLRAEPSNGVGSCQCDYCL